MTACPEIHSCSCQEIKSQPPLSAPWRWVLLGDAQRDFASGVAGTTTDLLNDRVQRRLPKALMNCQETRSLQNLFTYEYPSAGVFLKNLKKKLTIHFQCHVAQSMIVF